MERNERYLVTDDDCNNERSELVNRLHGLIVQTRDEMQKVDDRFWTAWKKSHNPDEWSGLGKDPDIAAYMAKTWYGKGPDLSSYGEKIKALESELASVRSMPCEKVHKILNYLRQHEENKVSSGAGSNLSKTQPPMMYLAEFKDMSELLQQLNRIESGVESGPPEMNPDELDEWTEALESGDEKAWLDEKTGSGPPEVDLSEFTSPPADIAHLSKQDAVVSVVAKKKTGAIRFGPNAKKDAVSEYSLSVIHEVAEEAEVDNLEISSTLRTYEAQARAMFHNLEKGQSPKYGDKGQQVISAYHQAKSKNKTAAEIQQVMVEKAREIKWQSGHMQMPEDYAKLNVIDIAPSSIKHRAAFEKALDKAKSGGKISKWLGPKDKDPAYHIEIPQPPENQ